MATVTTDMQTDAFFRTIEESGALPVGITAGTAATISLCHLLRRVSGGEARDFAESAPPTLRALILPCATQRDEYPETFDRATFLCRVADELQIDVDAAARLSRAVFAAVQLRLPRKEIDDVESQLPSDLRELWRRPDLRTQAAVT